MSNKRKNKIYDMVEDELNSLSKIKDVSDSLRKLKKLKSKQTDIKEKLQLTYIRIPKGTVGCISESHYDLCTLEKNPKNIGCILTDKEGAKLIRKWINLHNNKEDWLAK